MRKRNIAAAALMVAFGLSIAQAGAQDIVIGGVFPLTGGVSYDGQTDMNGAKTAVE
jgi:hypothetical protein